MGLRFPIFFIRAHRADSFALVKMGDISVVESLALLAMQLVVWELYMYSYNDQKSYKSQVVVILYNVHYTLLAGLPLKTIEVCI